MPSVPRRTAPVSPGAIPRVRVSTDAPAEAFGAGPSSSRVFDAARGLAQTGQEIVTADQRRRSVAEAEFLRFQEEEKRKADEVIVRDADLFLAQRETQRSIEIRNMRGRAAAGAVDFVESQWAKDVEEAQKMVFNDEQRFALEKIAANRYATLNRSAQIHTDTALREYDDEQAEVYIRAHQEQAAQNYSDPDVVGRSLFIQDREVEKTGARLGKSPEWIALTKAQKRSQTHAKILERMLVDGQDDAAKAYEQKVKGEILDDELGTLAKVRKETDVRRKENKDALERELYIRMMERDLDLPAVNALLASGQIDIPFYEKLRGRILSVNDDPAIPGQEKTKRLFEVMNRFSELNGAGVDIESQKIESVASGNRLDQLKAFRAFVAESAPYLTEAQEKAFYRFTQKDFDDATAGKVGAFRSLMRMLSDSFSRAPAAIAPIAGPILQKAMGIFEQSVSVANAMETTQILKDETAVATNPNRSRYAIGQVISLPQGDFEVIGYDEDGEPRVKRRTT